MVIILAAVVAFALLVSIGVPAKMVGVLIGLGALWWLSLLIWPEKRCWRCHGNGQHGGPLNFARTCGECRGTGRVRRIGAGD